MLPEAVHKVKFALIPAASGDFGDGVVGGGEQLCGMLHAAADEPFAERHSDGTAKASDEGGGRKAAVGGEGFHGERLCKIILYI